MLVPSCSFLAHGLDGLVDLHLDVGIHGVLEDLSKGLPEAGVVDACHVVAVQVGGADDVVAGTDGVAEEERATVMNERVNETRLVVIRKVTDFNLP